MNMQLMRVGQFGEERPAVRVSDDSYIDVSDVTADFDERFFAESGLAALRPVVTERQRAGQAVALNGERIGAPIARPHQILCIGLNYRDHAAETGQAVPDEPIVFNKSPNTLIGPNDSVRIPRGATKTDWEVELGIVIGTRSSYLRDEAAAAAAIAGYVLVNDVSERAFQNERGGQWVKGKSAETFNPCGPYLVTPDEIPDVLNLHMWLNVNGVQRQHGNTATMLFSPTYIVHYLSQFMVLEPGDLINTGTPPGVGMGFNPPIWLQPGDVMELGIDQLGTQRQTVLPPLVLPPSVPAPGRSPEGVAS
jgi:2,4-didehydro-3-deoxy-L-rhamnonate hydrolase